MIANSRLKADTFNLPAPVSVEEREDEEYFTPEMMRRIDQAFKEAEEGKVRIISKEEQKSFLGL